jgi:hemoglobin
MSDRPTLYAFAGGEIAFLKLAAAHHARCLADPELAHPFEHLSNPAHVESLANYWAEVFGGPPRFSETSSHSAMLRMHAGYGIPREMSARFEDCFLGALDDAGLPDDAEFRRVLREYIEWATREVDGYSPAGSAVKDALPMPRWGWEGLEPG